MINVFQLLRMLQVAMALLVASIGTPQQPHAVAVAQHTLQVVQQQIKQDHVQSKTKPVTKPMETQPSTTQPEMTPPSTVPAMPSSNTTSNPIPAPAPTQTVSPTPVNPAPATVQAPVPSIKIEIVSPTPGQGLGRQYLSRDTIKDQFNYVALGLVVTDKDGVNIQDKVVNITATDSTQNKTLNGTGTFWGNPHNVFYYPYEYDFKTPGDHIIQFECEGVTVSVTLHADPDTRP